MALAYVRTLELTTSNINVLFNDDIDTNIGVGNVTIVSEFDSIPNPEIKSVSVENDIVSISFSALFPNTQYRIAFVNTSDQAFQSVNGDRIFEDGNRNSFFIVSPGEEESEIRDAMFDDTSVLYETGEPTFVRNLISLDANQLQKASDSIETTKSSNYISVLVENEVKTRGDGPIDKLDHGGAFEILRVSQSPSSANIASELEFNSSRVSPFSTRDDIIINPILQTLTGDPISVQSIDIISEKVTDDIGASNHFSGLLIKVSNIPVIQVISVSLKRDNIYTEYDINEFGYALKDNRYDTTLGSINVNLLDGEIALSSSSITGLSGGFLLPRAGDEIYVSYVYKKFGRNIDSDSVNISRVRNSVRELVPAVINRFTLENAPIVTQLDTVATSNGVAFLLTHLSNGQPAFTAVHPAFANEIPYNITRLPSSIGEYSVNYETGDVFVYGDGINNSGTGDDTPIANYLYRQSFVSGLDFTFNGDIDEIAVNSTRGLIGLEAKITFDYEDTLAVGTDYRVLSHVEVLNERAENRLTSDFTIQSEYFPVTNVFRILNETTGELYDLERFNDTSISFTGTRQPRQHDITRERALFERVPQEILLVSDEFENSLGLRVLKVDLENNGITDAQGTYIGANFDSSVVFSDTDLFVREFFYEDRLFQNVDTNICRLEGIGDYIIDYTNGIVYVAVSSAQGTDLGDIIYRHKQIETLNKHILGVNDIYRSKSSIQPNITTYSIGTITDTTVGIIGLEQVGARFVNNDVVRTLLVGTHKSGEDGVAVANSNVFSSFGAIFTSADIGRTLVVGSASQTPVQEVLITGIVSNHEVTVDPVLNYTKSGRVWSVLDLSTGASKTITLDYDIVTVKDIYTVTQVGSLPFSLLDGYFDVDNDTVSGNTITLSDSSNLNVGDAIVVNYNPGSIFVDYRYLQDEILVSYEYGNNSLDWSLSDALLAGEEYYVTYKYGALRESLLLNFGSLTQISQLTNFSPNLDRELYRSIVSGTLQSFVEGPTITSLERLVESFTDVTPEISETAFDNWVLGRDNLHLRDPEYSSGQMFDIGKFDNGVIIGDTTTIQIPALSHFKLSEGTLEAWIRPQWSGIANDATLTFDLSIDGYSDPTDVYIGFSGTNPTSIPFSLSVNDDISVFNEPIDLNTTTGFFIWFDDTNNTWNFRWSGATEESKEFSGSITTDGEFYGIARPIASDGYEINEITDVITSTIHGIDFTAFIDDLDAVRTSGEFATDGISFYADNSHYIFDMAEKPAANRVSLFRDGTGYLNFQVFDNMANFGLAAGFYNISKNIRDWESGSLHHVAISWKFNSSDERDEMHMFVDGEEVTNLFKYGGNPKASSLFDFGDVSEETIVNYSLLPILGARDGSTTAGSTLFMSESADFGGSGVLVGHLLYLLDDTADGVGDPNFGATYTVTGVGTTTLTLDRAPTLTIGDLHYSINSLTSTVSSLVNIQDFVVIVSDILGNETELNGLDSEFPDYSVRRGSDNTHVITINNGISVSDSAVIKPLGLLLKRCRERVYVYDGGYDELRVNSASPVSLSDIRITSIILDRTLIATGDGFGMVGTIIGAQLVSMLQSYFDSVCQPSNQSSGRRLAITMSGNNFNYDIHGNKVIISGTTNSGAIKETILFTESTTISTNEYWTYIDSIVVSALPIDASIAAGAIEIKEYQPITISENNGDFAEVVEYSNGIIRLETYGTGGNPFILNGCTYEIDYPSYLRIRVDAQPDTFYIGSDYAGENRLDGIMDEFRILDYISSDTRVGELVTSGSITTDYTNLQSFSDNSNTLLLLHFNDSIEDSSTFRVVQR